MMMPSVFGRDIFDDFMDGFAFPDVSKELYGKHAKQIMKTDVKELENGYEITVRAGLHCSPLIHEAMGTKNSGTVRVSVSWFTKEEEILAFLEAAGQIAASLRGAD